MKILLKLLTVFTIALMLGSVLYSSQLFVSALDVSRGKKILFDQTHSEYWSLGSGYTEFARVAANMGYTLVPVVTGPLTLDMLKQYHILVIALAQYPFSTSEVTAIQSWVRYYGGRILVLNEWGDDEWSSNMDTLCLPFGIQFNDDMLYDPTNYDVHDYWIKFHVFASHTITSGLSIVQLFLTGSISIINSAVAKPLIYGDSDTWSAATVGARGPDDTPTATQPTGASPTPALPIGRTTYVVATASTYGTGKVVAIGDSDVFDDWDVAVDNDGLMDIYEYDNARFLQNVLTWLQPTPMTEWTFMVYLDGDNNLDSYALKDINEMEVAGSTDKVNIVVMLDRYGSTGTWIYYVQKDANTGVISSPIVLTLSEQNMGDPATLTFFIEWTMQHYPAKRYALDFWDHGSGWKLIQGGVVPVDKGVCYDDTNADHLTTAELKDALYYTVAYGYIGLIGFDACLMGMVEIAYQLRIFADVMVASEETVPGDGWPYNTILASLIATPTMTAKTLGTNIVTKYKASYASGSDVTMSAVDLKKIDQLAAAIKSFAIKLKKYWSSCHDKIISARTSTEVYADITYADLYHFATLLKAQAGTPTELKSACDLVRTALTTAVFTNGHGNLHPNSRGLSIYFPRRGVSSYDSAYVGLDFTIYSQWNVFLNLYLTGPI